MTYARSAARPRTGAFLWTLALATLAACTGQPDPRLKRSEATLQAAAKYGFEASVYSFEHNTRDPLVTNNDWDIQYGNGGDQFGVHLATNDASRILDLGWLQWSQLDLDDLPDLPAHPEPMREPSVRAVPGHIYLLHTKDDDSDLMAVFRLDTMISEESATVSWALVPGAAATGKK